MKFEKEKEAMREDKNIIFLTKLKNWIDTMDQKEWRKVVLIGLFGLATLVGNVFSSVLNNVFHNFPTGKPMGSIIGFHFIRYFAVYLILYLLVIPLYYYIWFRIKVNYESLEEGDKATGRWTTDDEIRAQFKEVAIRAHSAEEEYPGLSGTITKRIGDKVYLDTDPAHNSILGRSRAAKGETLVLPNMDIYSRSEEKPHLVFTSGKYELAVAGMGKKTLQRRGYECHVLNLIDLMRSFQYNPLELIKQAYMEGDIDNAIELCKTFSYPLYHNEEAREPVWEETAMALVNGIILALCYEFIEKSDDPKKTEKYVSMYAVSSMMIELGTINDEGGETLLDKYFSNLPSSSPARMEYSTVMYAQGQMRASIFASTQAKLRSFTSPKVAKMMAKSTFDFRKLTKDSKPINMTRDIKVTGYVDTAVEGDYTLTYSITNDFDEEYTAKRLVTVKKGTVYQSFPNKVDYFTGLENIEMNVDVPFDPRAGVECWYHYKPQAVFLVLPDYIQTNYIVASTWISQMYHVVSDFAANLTSGKLLKRIRVVLDEFGNLPGFSNIGSMLSVGAGRGILFDFYVQHPNQLTTRYSEKVGEFIADEAMNHYFLLSGSKKAREDFSALLGEKEVTVKSRSGGLFDINKQFTETVEPRPLLRPDELGRLEEGEVVVERSIKRQDLKGNSVRPYPIFNTGENSKLFYAHTYLSDLFDPQGSWQSLDLPHVPDIPLEEYSRNFVERIKHPLSQQDANAQLQARRKELEAIMNEPEAVLDQHYKGAEQPDIAANLNDLEPVFVGTDRKLMVEVVGSDNIAYIHGLLVEDQPQLEAAIDELEYYDEYERFIQKQASPALKIKLNGMGHFVEPDAQS